MLVWALWKAIGRLDWRYAAVLVGYGAGYLPWFTNLDRQMYFFYATPLAPFLVIGITLVLGDVLGRARVGVERRLTSVAVVAIYVGLVVANFIWLWPILNGDRDHGRTAAPWRPGSRPGGDCLARRRRSLPRRTGMRAARLGAPGAGPTVSDPSGLDRATRPGLARRLVGHARSAV